MREHNSYCLIVSMEVMAEFVRELPSLENEDWA